ncbi:hypothetical protein GTY86_11830 [Streptomyces sp. SID5770]|uniref:hypothetical protein n=1 Tax=Streptomyces sp. SID5770 TaxID=2690308 RepID=UPI001370355C|nr:hypothetical protein [Streptomyces sp. SID5770]MZE51974.1 hypothetical protein [Streptomyces sp. SID5770]
MKKYLSAASTAGASAGPATAAPVAAAAPTEAAPAKAPTPIRTVRPGERVDAGRGHTVWLTKKGKHGSDPDGLEDFRSAAGVFPSGLSCGTRTVGRVEPTDARGRTILSTLLELPGRPGWGVWYAHTGAGAGEVSAELYDRAGDRLGGGPVRGPVRGSVRGLPSGIPAGGTLCGVATTPPPVHVHLLMQRHVNTAMIRGS